MGNNETKNITCSDMEFLELLVQHIPNQYSHMIYYYGIFANRVKKDYLALINKLYPSPRIYPRVAKNFKWRFCFGIITTLSNVTVEDTFTNLKSLSPDIKHNISILLKNEG
jgi:hypothetical protein